MLYQTFERPFSSLLIRLNKSIVVAQNKQLSSLKQSTKNSLDITKVHDLLKKHNLENYIKIFKKKLKVKINKNTRFDLIDPCSAKTLSTMISKKLLKSNSIVIECNPGLGLLTEELLNIGVTFIHLFEPNKIFNKKGNPLAILCDKYHKQLSIKKQNFYKIWLELIKKKFNHLNNVNNYMADIEYQNLKQETPFYIICGVVSRSFMIYLIHNFCEQTEIFRDANPTFYIVISPLIWMRLSYTFPNIRFYGRYTVLLHLFFDIKYLGDVPRAAYIPWTKEMLDNTIDEFEMSMFVIEVKPKKEFDSLIAKEDIISFSLFLNHCLRSKNLFVIKELERFVPDCGLRLIKMQMNICTRFKELTPEELLNLFKNFRSWPEYDVRLFYPSHREDIIERCNEDDLL